MKSDYIALQVVSTENPDQLPYDFLFFWDVIDKKKKKNIDSYTSLHG